MTQSLNHPKVSIIITCFNHGRFLSPAIESVLSQSYPSVEIILVDDGSTDNTKNVADLYPTVKYIYQRNSGLSSARNTGIDNSEGSFLVFLDADDWLLPEAIATNAAFLLKDPSLAFVSGSHQRWEESRGVFHDDIRWSGTDHYLSLLQSNYISMHAAVMYQRWTLEKFRFNESLSNCEDYDLYLRITRDHKVSHHQQTLAVYRIHKANMSGDFITMLRGCLLVLEQQRPVLRTAAEKEALEKGILNWKIFYSEQLFKKLSINNVGLDADRRQQEIAFLSENAPGLYRAYLRNYSGGIKFKRRFGNFFKKVFADIYIRWIRSASDKLSSIGMDPLSVQFGYDRGGPVDRYYIEKFLQQNAGNVKGRILEIGDNSYTIKYGGAKITQTDILHVDEKNKEATIIGDLTNIPHVQDDLFDCIILTQTLHLIYDFKTALVTCERILKPGGMLILTVPGISHIAQDQWGKYWQWSFTHNSLNKSISDTFTNGKVNIETFGNVLVASAFLYGMGLPELSKEQLDYHDIHYQVIIAATAIKADKP